MTEVPGSEWYKLDDAASDAIPKPHFPMEGDWQNCGNIEHVFTHFALTLTVWKLNSDEAPTQMGGGQKKGKFEQRSAANCVQESVGENV